MTSTFYVIIRTCFVVILIVMYIVKIFIIKPIFIHHRQYQYSAISGNGNTRNSVKWTHVDPILQMARCSVWRYTQGRKQRICW